MNLKKLIVMMIVLVSLGGCSLFQGNDGGEYEDYKQQPPKTYSDNFPPPVCKNIDSMDLAKRGWYQSTELVLEDSTCEDGKLAVCLYGGLDKEGWYTSELGEAIEYRDCVIHSQFAVYFINESDDESCAGTKAVKLTVYKETPGENTYEKVLNILLAGVPADAQNLSTSIPQGVELISASYEAGKLTANFSSALDTFGSCSQEQIRAQIEKTLKFTPVVTKRIIDEIEIQIDGEIWE